MTNNYNTFKVPSNLDNRWNSLTLTAKAIYVIIATKSDFKTGESRIKRETICNLLGLKDEEIITKYTNQLHQLGLITKRYLDKNHLKVVYTVENLQKFSLLSRDVVKMGLNDKQLGLFVSLCSLRSNGTEITLPYLYKECNVAKRTFYKYIKELESLDLIEYSKGCVSLLEFIPDNKSMNKVARKLWDDFEAANENLPKEEQHPKYKAIKKKEQSGWDGINSVSQFIIKMLTGVTMSPIRKKNKSIIFSLNE